MRRRWILFFVAVAVLVALIGWEWSRFAGAIGPSTTTIAQTSNVTANTVALQDTSLKDNSPNPARKIRRESNSRTTATQINATDSVDSSTQSARRHNINPNAPAPLPTHVSLLPIDHDHAMDLFADEIANEENGGGDETLRKLLKQFQPLPPSTDRTDELRANLDAWTAELYSTQREHFAIIDVECRANICRILMAQNGLGGGLGSVAVRLPDALRQQSWWNRMGVVGMTYDGSLIGEDGYGLETIYIILPADS